MQENPGDTEKKVAQLKNDISVLSSKLRELGAEKEAKYRVNSSLTNKLNKLIKEANQLKDSKSAISARIKEHKTKRELYNKEVSELASQLRKFRNDGKTRLPVGHVPSERIGTRLEELNLRLETEAVPFEKEQALMGQIKEIKLRLKEAMKAEEGIRALAEMRKHLNEKKKLSDDAHRAVQEFAGQDTELFKQLTEKSLIIAGLKKEKSALRDVLIALKQQIYEMNEQLASKLGEWSKYKKSASERRIQAEAAKLVAKTKAVREKLRAKEKLTTEDILLLQRESLGKR